MNTNFRSMIAMDLDGTMVGDAEALARLNEALCGLRGDVALAYVTGRTLGSALELLEAEGLLRPHFLITDVGASIHAGPDWHEDAGWRKQLARGWSSERVRAAATFFPALEPQPAEHQGAFKCSYYLDAQDVLPTLQLLGDALRRQRLGARIIYSSGHDLDLVPARAGKGHALRYLARRIGVPLTSVFACGDCGNDREMLVLECHAAVVANAQPELDSLPTCVYRASEPYAAGVHEALRHYGWL